MDVPLPMPALLSACLPAPNSNDPLLLLLSPLPRLGPREISTVIWAAAKAGARPPAPSAPPSACWLPPLLARASQLQPRLNPQDISMLLWALATLSEAGPSGGARNRREGGMSGWQQGGAGNTGSWQPGGTGCTGSWQQGGTSSTVLESAAQSGSDRANFSSTASGPSSTSFLLRGLPPSLLRGLLASAAAKMDMFGPQVPGVTSHLS